MNDTGFKYTYFNNLFIPIILIILVLTFVFIILIVPYDMKAYSSNISKTVTSFLNST